MQRLRIGIDVGGTFTDVVAIDATTRELIAQVKVPTSHDAAEGVAAGIVAGIQRLLAQTGLDAASVGFIAHSTTQATNALLEGDVARVGVIELADGVFAPLVRRAMRVRPIPLAAGRTLRALPLRERDLAGLRSSLDAIAVSAPFAIDAPGREAASVAAARDAGFFATSGSEVSTLYGLRARTRTAVVNAAILPTMVRTARMTTRAVADAGIGVPLMIMRSDGGVMDVREVERRPILTLLSGPAAGVAGALLYENVTDGIFIEVGGTSADCAAIRGGVPQLQAGQIGGERMMMRTLDVRSIAIGGGSMARVAHGRVVDAGPRSAHIAGLAYATFLQPAQIAGANVQTLAPLAGDPDDYLAFLARDGTRFTVTTTCAANALGLVPDGAFARGDAEAARTAFALAGAHLGIAGDALARGILDAAAAKVATVVDALVRDYALDPATLVLIGGGGGAGALLPATSERTGVPTRIARNAEVISPIGVALALVRDVIERTVVDPTPEDVVRIRRDARDAAVAAGADPDLVEVTIEIDRQRNLVRATASGATALARTETTAASGVDGRDAASRTLRLEPLTLAARAGAFAIYTGERAVRGAFGSQARRTDAAIVDARGVVRLVVHGPAIATVRAETLATALPDLLERATAFGDVGRALPEIVLVYGARIARFNGLASADHVVALATEEMSGLDPETPVVLLALPNVA